MKTTKYILILTILLLTVACEDFLELNNPNAIVAENFFSTPEEIEQAVNGAYATLVRSDYLDGLYKIGDMRSDDTEPGDDALYVSVQGGPLDNFFDDPTGCIPDNAYSVNYIGIGRANAVINRTAEANIGDEDLKNRYIGEAKFLRAMFYFNLVRFFGDVPLVESEITSFDGIEQGRAPLEEIYEKMIIPDLEDAAAKLPDVYDGNDKGRAGKYAAISLLAKVYLTIGSMQLNINGVSMPFQLARDHALDVIQNGPYALENNYADVFDGINENGIESIFELQFIVGNGTGYQFEGCRNGSFQPQRQGEGHSLVNLYMPRFQGVLSGNPNAPFLEGWGINTPTYSNDPRDGVDGVPVGTGIVEAFEEGDTRKDYAIFDYRKVFEELNIPINEELSLYNIFKYRETEGQSNHESSDNYYILRLADVYLMFAEAENEINNGPTAEAYLYINEVRRRAFKDTEHDLKDLDYNSFLDAIYHERRVELCFEGQRWFDLARRPQKGLAILHAQGKTNANLDRMLLPIPQRVFDQSNGRITQNDGY